MIKKVDEKEALEIKKIYDDYLHKRTENMNSTNFKVEDIFGNVISNDSISPDQLIRINNFFSKNDVNININIKFNFLNLKRKQVFILNALLRQLTTKFC